jgi:hypothetical protein
MWSFSALGPHSAKEYQMSHQMLILRICLFVTFLLSCEVAKSAELYLDCINPHDQKSPMRISVDTDKRIVSIEGGGTFTPGRRDELLGCEDMLLYRR